MGSGSRKNHVVLLPLTDLVARATLQVQGYQSRKVATSAGRIHVLEADGRGNLPPIVLLHGLSSAGAHYLPLLHRLRPAVRHLAAPDMPAHGFSDHPPQMNGESLEAGLVEALDDIIKEPSILFGNSLGGIAAIHYALRRPERVKALILASPSGAPMTAEELERFVATFHIGTHAEALAFIDKVLAKPGLLRHAFAVGVGARFKKRYVQELLASIKPEDLLRSEQLKALHMPILLLWGKSERILPRAHLEWFRKNLPAHARIEEPVGFGHSPFLDDSPGLAKRILAFCREVTAPPGRDTKPGWLARAFSRATAASAL